MLSAPVKVRSEIGLEWAAKLWSRQLLDGAPGGTVKSRTEPAASPHRSLVPAASKSQQVSSWAWAGTRAKGSGSSCTPGKS